jgi:GH24 family phage-related lysozyme (muramidase)
MSLHPNTLRVVVPLIEEFEGVRYEAYLCPAGVPTICAGITRYPNGSPVQLGDVCSDSACKGYLEEELEKEFIPGCERIPGFSEMGANRQAALIDFAWNMGAHFYGSNNFETITRVLRDGASNPDAYKEMRSALALYVNGGGGPLPGLVRRRDREADLWEQEDNGQMALVSIQDTYFKKAAIDSSYLADGTGKLLVRAGNSIPISQLNEVAGDSHAEIVVADTGDKWFVYQPHWEVTSAKKS